MFVAAQSTKAARAKQDAVTQIRTAVAAATTQSANHYTITTGHQATTTGAQVSQLCKASSGDLILHDLFIYDYSHVLGNFCEQSHNWQQLIVVSFNRLNKSRPHCRQEGTSQWISSPSPSPLGHDNHGWPSTYNWQLGGHKKNFREQNI